MNMNVSVLQSLQEKGDAAVRLAERVAYYMAPILQVSGISYIRLSQVDSMSGPMPVAKEIDFFEGVPEDIMKWSEGIARGASQLMYSAGISSIGMMPGSIEGPGSAKDDPDLDAVRSVWAYVSGVAGNVSGGVAERPSEGEPEVKAAADSADSVPDPKPDPEPEEKDPASAVEEAVPHVSGDAVNAIVL